jgi:hypothetical protein
MDARTDDGDGGRRDRLGTMTPTSRPLGEFRDAVLALSDDPDPENVARYLAASRALDGFGEGEQDVERRAFAPGAPHREAPAERLDAVA